VGGEQVSVTEALNEGTDKRVNVAVCERETVVDCDAEKENEHEGERDDEEVFVCGQECEGGVIDDVLETLMWNDLVIEYEVDKVSDALLVRNTEAENLCERVFVVEPTDENDGDIEDVVDNDMETEFVTMIVRE
jgi:hypothetical protein